MSVNKIDSVFYQELELAPDFEFDVRVIRTREDALYRGLGKYDLHYHNCWEIDYVTKGEGINIFEKDVYSFAPGDIYIIHPYEMHNAFPTGEIELFCIQFSENNVVRSVFTDAEYRNELTQNGARFPSVIRKQDQNYDLLQECILKTLKEWRERRTGWRPAMRLCLAQMFLELVRDFSEKGETCIPEESIQSEGIRQALDFINANFTKKISLEQAAQEAIMHKNYFCTMFKKQVGVTFYTYLNGLRLRHACALLKSTDRPVKDIAISSGFPAVSSFNKAFRKAFRITPVEYRAGSMDVVMNPEVQEDDKEWSAEIE